MNTHDILDALTGGNDDFLFARANEMRQWIFGSEVYLRAIIEFSNVCDKHCRYCGMRADNRKLNRYRLHREAILENLALAVSQGAESVILQSGCDTSYSTEQIGDLIRAAKTAHGVGVALSLGDRRIDEYAYWRECGADRCLIRLETTDPARYKDLRQGESFTGRLHMVEELCRMGYEIGSGVIVGLPEATPMDALRDILFLTQLDLDMIEVEPFVPTPDTPLAANPPGSVILSQRMAALLRLMNPKADIPAASTLDALSPGSRAMALTKGCNVFMPSISPGSPHAGRSVHPNRNADGPDHAEPLVAAHKTIVAMGFVPSASKGCSPRRSHVG
jgi:biotin synthase